MSQYRDSVEDILSKIKLESDKSEETQKAPANTITITRCSFGNASFFAGILVGVSLCLSLFFGVLLITGRTDVSFLPTREQAEGIDFNEINEIKELVARVSECEQKHPNLIHYELKKIFNYYSYKKITPSLYRKIKALLSVRARCKRSS